MSRRFLNDIKADISALSADSTGALLGQILNDTIDSTVQQVAAVYGDEETAGVVVTTGFLPLTTVYTENIGGDGEFLRPNYLLGRVLGSNSPDYHYDVRGKVSFKAGQDDTFELVILKNGSVVEFGLYTSLTVSADGYTTAVVTFTDDEAPADCSYTMAIRSTIGGGTIDVDHATLNAYILPTVGVTTPVDPVDPEETGTEMFRVMRHLLPNGRAWRTTIDKPLTRFLQGLGTAIEAVRNALDSSVDDIDPQKTRNLALYEDQFGLPTSALTTQQRRDRLDAAWKEKGGQSPSYIQKELRAQGFDVYVHEWWADAIGTPRDPNEVLTDGTKSFGYYSNCGGSLMVSGGSQVCCGAANGVSGGLLVNLPTKTEYNIPTDPNEWAYILYIGGANWGDVATVPFGRRDEFERLCLKICPAQQFIGLIVGYS